VDQFSLLGFATLLGNRRRTPEINLLPA
jgi:hypothetical protein